MSTQHYKNMQQTVENFAPWFHNLHLLNGVETAPDHPLGDFPHNKWETIADYFPDSLSGWTVLDVGCNAGYYSFELAKRGAKVTAIDCDSHYLRQAIWAADQLGLSDSIEFRQQQVYDLAREPARYDVIWFMGVFYHLRYPQLALDILARKTRRMMVFQSMTMPSEAVVDPPEDFPLDDRQRMHASGWPKLAFIEKRMANDPTNWWAPNHACIEALLRASGLRVVTRPAQEIYLCELSDADPLGMNKLNDQQYRAAVGDSVGYSTEP